MKRFSLALFMVLMMVASTSWAGTVRYGATTPDATRCSAERHVTEPSVYVMVPPSPADSPVLYVCGRDEETYEGGATATSFSDGSAVDMEAKVGGASDGSYVIAWSLDDDGGDAGVFARRYSSAGVAVGSAFQANTYTTGAQNHPSIAVHSDGTFVTVWESDAQDGNAAGVFAQRFNSSGVAQASEFQITTHTTLAQSAPQVAALASGAFVAVWQSASQDGNAAGVFARRFSSAGVGLGSEFQVTTYTAGAQAKPVVAAAASGAFVVAWESAAQDGDLGGIYAKAYSAAGAVVGAEFAINSIGTGDQTDPAIAATADDGFLVTYVQAGLVHGRTLSTTGASGTAVSDITGGDEIAGSVALGDDSDTYVLAWSSDDGGDARAALITQAGLVHAPRDLLADAAFSTPALAGTSVGSLVVTWEGEVEEEPVGFFARLWEGWSQLVTVQHWQWIGIELD